MTDQPVQPPGTPQSRLSKGDWARFRRLMAWTALVSILVVVLALLWLRQAVGPLPFHLVLATALGLAGMVVLTGLLMGLVFMSARSGADDRADGSSGGGA